MAGQGIGRGAMVGGVAVLAGVFGVVVWLLTGRGEVAAPQDQDAPGQTQAESALPSGAGREAEGARAADDKEPVSQEAAEAEVAPQEGQPAPEAEAVEAAGTAAPQAPTAPDAPDAPTPPQIDIARLSPDGNAVIAGLGTPGAILRVMVDGSPAYETEVDAGGNFVALFDLPPSRAPRELWLETEIDGQRSAADEVLMILPGETLAMGGGGDDPAPAAGDAALAEEARETEGEAATETASAAPTETAPAEDTSAPRLMLAGKDGVKLLDPGAEAGALSLDSISYDAAGAVSIAGRGTGELRLYLNDALIGSVLAKAGQWALELPSSVTPGVYDLRVDAIGADGNVRERIESPFMRESQELLAQAAAAQAAAEGGDAAAGDTARADSTSDGAQTGLAETIAQAAGAVADAVEGTLGGPEADQPTAAESTATTTANAAGAEDMQAEGEAAPEAEVAAASAPDAEVTAEAAPVPDMDNGADTGTGTAPSTDTGTNTGMSAGTDTVTDPAPAVRARVVTVQPGNTLWAISRAQYGDGVLYVRVFEANRSQIRDPDLIYPGQVFTLPE